MPLSSERIADLESRIGRTGAPQSHRVDRLLYEYIQSIANLEKLQAGQLLVFENFSFADPAGEISESGVQMILNEMVRSKAVLTMPFFMSVSSTARPSILHALVPAAGADAKSYPEYFDNLCVYSVSTLLRWYTNLPNKAASFRTLMNSGTELSVTSNNSLLFIFEELLASIAHESSYRLENPYDLFFAEIRRRVIEDRKGVSLGQHLLLYDTPHQKEFFELALDALTEPVEELSQMDENFRTKFERTRQQSLSYDANATSIPTRSFEVQIAAHFEQRCEELELPELTRGRIAARFVGQIAADALDALRNQWFAECKQQIQEFRDGCYERLRNPKEYVQFYDDATLQAIHPVTRTAIFRHPELLHVQWQSAGQTRHIFAPRHVGLLRDFLVATNRETTLPPGRSIELRRLLEQDQDFFEKLVMDPTIQAAYDEIIESGILNRLSPLLRFLANLPIIRGILLRFAERSETRLIAESQPPPPEKTSQAEARLSGNAGPAQLNRIQELLEASYFTEGRVPLVEELANDAGLNTAELLILLTDYRYTFIESSDDPNAPLENYIVFFPIDASFRIYSGRVIDSLDKTVERFDGRDDITPDQRILLRRARRLRAALDDSG